MSLLAELRAGGLHLEPRDNGKVHVRPLGALTPARRQTILMRKVELLAALELERRIRAMCSRWEYSAEELAEAFEGAQRDPAYWVACCAADEATAELLRDDGIPFRSVDVH